jgi:hypothetical protein
MGLLKSLKAGMSRGMCQHLFPIFVPQVSILTTRLRSRVPVALFGRQPAPTPWASAPAEGDANAYFGRFQRMVVRLPLVGGDEPEGFSGVSFDERHLAVDRVDRGEGDVAGDLPCCFGVAEPVGAIRAGG